MVLVLHDSTERESNTLFVSDPCPAPQVNKVDNCTAAVETIE